MCSQKLVILSISPVLFLIDRCKSWKTYTLSYYDNLLRELIKLAIMVKKNEYKSCCALFLFGIINRRDGTSYTTYSFNPIGNKSDEHPGNRIAIEKVFGKDFLENRTEHRT